MTKKITIETNISEKDFMESILNQTAMGYDLTLVVSFYALIHKWKYSKLIYYNKLMDEVQR